MHFLHAYDVIPATDPAECNNGSFKVSSADSSCELLAVVVAAATLLPCATVITWWFTPVHGINT
jgi:hypothetical protein